jgi:hypothetical protein
MESPAAYDIYRELIKLSDEELFKLAEDNNLYDDNEMKRIAKTLDINHSKYNNEELEREIVFDFINRLLQKNNPRYDPNELINVKISERQFVKAIDDISKNSIYFRNEAEYCNLFFDTKYKTTIMRNEKYYFDTIKSILKLFAIHLKKTKRKLHGKIVRVYMLTINKEIKRMADRRQKIIEKMDAT